MEYIKRNDNLKKCLSCYRDIRGRMDKKFCSDACRSSYNKQQRDKSENKVIHEINKRLLDNRNVLKKLKAENQFVRLEELFIHGFHWGIMTQVLINKKKDRFIFCYDLGYSIQNRNRIRIITQEEEYLIPENTVIAKINF